MNAFKKYRKKGITEIRRYVERENTHITSISPQDLKDGSPKKGDMIARDPENHDDQWLIAKAYFKDNYEVVKK